MNALLMILAAIALAWYGLRIHDEWEHRRNVKRTLRLIQNWYGQ